MAEDMPASGPDVPVPVAPREPDPAAGQGAGDGVQPRDRGRLDLPPSGGGR
jgi:hypothetical protein